MERERYWCTTNKAVVRRKDQKFTIRCPLLACKLSIFPPQVLTLPKIKKFRKDSFMDTKCERFSSDFKTKSSFSLSIIETNAGFNRSW